MKKKIFLTSLVLLWITQTFGQTVTGTVYELGDDKQKTPLTGVNVYWAQSLEGTISDDNGKFNISKTNAGDDNLVFSFIGYKKDTVQIRSSVMDLEVGTSNKPGFGRC